MEIDISQLIKFIEAQIQIFKVLPASDYGNGILKGMNMVLRYINSITKGESYEEI